MSQRFSKALELMTAAICVAVYGSIAGEPENRRPSGHIQSLEDEFSDLFTNARINRFLLDAVTDNPSRYQLDARIYLLKHATVMPSQVIRTIAREIGCSGKFPRPSLQLSAYRGVGARVARELGIDRSYLNVCWKTEADLDTQWHAMRRTLLEMRKFRKEHSL